MLEKIKESYREFKDAEPGHRFRERYERRQKESRGWLDPGKIINILLGLVITGIGFVLMPVPGPGGSVVTLLGLGLIGSEFWPLACFLDGLEVRLRKVQQWALSIWQRASVPGKVGISLALATLTSALGFGVYNLFFNSGNAES